MASERGTALWNTFYFALLVVPLQMTLGLTMALIVNAPIRGRTFFRSAYYFPALTSSAAISVIAIYLLNADGLVNAGISAVTGQDFNQPWFNDPDTALEVDRRPGRLDDVRDDDALLPRRAAIDPDGRLRGRGARRRRRLADVLAHHVPAAQAGALLRRRVSRSAR